MARSGHPVRLTGAAAGATEATDAAVEQAAGGATEQAAGAVGVDEPAGEPALGGWRPRLRLRRISRLLLGNPSAAAGTVLMAAWVLVALVGPWVAPYDPYRVSLTERFLPPGTAGHLLGTDHYGRDILSRLMVAAGLDLLIAVVAVAGAIGVGLPVGLVSGYFGGRLDNVLMRVMDVLLAFPNLVLAMALAAVLGPGLWNAIFALSLAGVAGYARIVRGLALSLREQPFVEAARASGAGDFYVMVRHILPHVLSPVIVRGTLGMGFTVLQAASLSFIGLGAQPPTAEWGAMINEGRNLLVNGVWWVSTFPGLAIMLAVLGCNLLGDGIRDLLDPRGATRAEL